MFAFSQIARDGEVALLSGLSDEVRSELSLRINDLDEKHLTPLHYAARLVEDIQVKPVA